MNRNLVLVAVSLFAWGMGEGLFVYFQPLYLQEFGADPVLIGGIFGAMGIAMAVAQIPAGYLSDRFGSRSIMWGSWVLGTIAAWVMAFAGSLPLFVTGLILYGLTGFVVAPMNSYITTVRGKMSIGRAISFCSGLYSLGAVIGPVIGGIVADRLGLRIVYMIAGILFVISTFIVFFTAKNPAPHHADQVSTQPKGLLKNYRFMAFVVMTGITLLALYIPQPFTPSFLQNQQQLSRTTIGLLGAVGSLGNAVATLALGSLNSIVGFIIAQIWVLIFTLVFLKGDSTIWFGMGYFFLGGYRLCRSMVLAIARSLIHPGQTGLAFGMMETASAVAVIIAPILAGFLYRQQPTLIYSFSAILIGSVIIANLLIFYIIRRRRKNNYGSES
jgi:MFS family permease